MDAILARARGLLAGEPARVIGYGAAVLIYLVAKASGKIPDVTFDEAVAQALTGITVLVSVIESIRHFVTPVR